MMSPNADLRCTAKQAMADAYWQGQKRDASHSEFPLYKWKRCQTLPSSERASSYTSTTSSVAFEKDMDRLITTPSAWKGVKDRTPGEKSVVETTNLPPPPELDIFGDSPEGLPVSREPRARSGLSRSKSQPRVGISKGVCELSCLTSTPGTYTLCHEQHLMVESAARFHLLENFHRSKLPLTDLACHRTYVCIHPTRAYPHRRRRRRIFLISTSWPLP